MEFMFIHSFTMLMILAWFFALGSLDLPHVMYENMYTYMFQPYNSFRIKCHAVNDFRKEGFNFQSAENAMSFDLLFNIIEKAEEGFQEAEEAKEAEEAEGKTKKPQVLPEELTKLKELFTKYSLSTWAIEDDFGYPFRECLTKELKDCTYPYWDMWYLSTGMGLLYVVGIASVIFNLPMIGKILKKSVVSTVLQSIGLLTYEPDLPFFAVFIVFMVSIYWGAVANRYEEDCQSVIDSKKEWYDKVPAYAVGGSVSLMLVQTALAERKKSQVRELLKNRIQELKNKKEMSEKEKWKNFMSAGSGSRLDKFVNKFGGGQRLDQKWGKSPVYQTQLRK